MEVGEPLLVQKARMTPEKFHRVYLQGETKAYMWRESGIAVLGNRRELNDSGCHGLINIPDSVLPIFFF